MLKWINLLCVIVSGVLVTALMLAGEEASSAEDRLAELRESLAEERGEINRLTADLAHLEDPETLRALARAHLGFVPITQEYSVADLPRLSEEEREAQASRRPAMVTLSAARIATAEGGAP